MTTTTEGAELLPCPHCEGPARWSPTYIDSDSPGTVICDCGATVICSGSKEERIAAWNRRTSSPEAVGEAVASRTSLGYHSMGSGGRCDWTMLREAVTEARTGRRQPIKPIRDDMYPGHEMVEGINYNSLDRIVTAFVDATLYRHPVAADREVIQYERGFGPGDGDSRVIDASDQGGE